MEHWFTAAWCARAEDAREIAEALASAGEPRQVRVWDHTATLADPAGGRARQIHAVDSGDGGDLRPWPELAVMDAGRSRPAGPGPDVAAEPRWLPGAVTLYRHALHVRTAGSETWRTLGWVLGENAADKLAAVLGVGQPGSRYPWGLVSGPFESSRMPDGDRQTITVYPARHPGEPERSCDYSREVWDDDSYEAGPHGRFGCALEAGHVERLHSI